MRIFYTACLKLSVVKYAKSHFGPPPTEKNMSMEKARGIITELREEKTLFSYVYGIAKQSDLKLDVRTG
jgi:hypothetical protein